MPPTTILIPPSGDIFDPGQSTSTDSGSAPPQDGSAPTDARVPQPVSPSNADNGPRTQNPIPSQKQGDSSGDEPVGSRGLNPDLGSGESSAPPLFNLPRIHSPEDKLMNQAGSPQMTQPDNREDPLDLNRRLACQENPDDPDCLALKKPRDSSPIQGMVVDGVPSSPGIGSTKTEAPSGPMNYVCNGVPCTLEEWQQTRIGRSLPPAPKPPGLDWYFGLKVISDILQALFPPPKPQPPLPAPPGPQRPPGAPAPGSPPVPKSAGGTQGTNSGPTAGKVGSGASTGTSGATSAGGQSGQTASGGTTPPSNNGGTSGATTPPPSSGFCPPGTTLNPNFVAGLPWTPGQYICQPIGSGMTADAMKRGVPTSGPPESPQQPTSKPLAEAARRGILSASTAPSPEKIWPSTGPVRMRASNPEGTPGATVGTPAPARVHSRVSDKSRGGVFADIRVDEEISYAERKNR